MLFICLTQKGSVQLCFGAKMRNNANISVLHHENCCGCRACGDVCPSKCISFVADKEEFIYPVIDESACISCGKCQKVCPAINQSYHAPAKKAIAAFAYNQEQRNAGSSGGLFGLLAIEIIERSGKVWGAAFDDKLNVRHQCASSIKELAPLMRSKYVQSNTSDIYTRIAKDIKDGILTLFSGTPCQCNAIRNVVGPTNLLITIEVVCHGVPSQSLFNQSIEWLEHRTGCKVTSFVFRSKYKNALHPHAFSYVCNSGNKEKTIHGLHYQFPFYFGFQKSITLRPSCYRCQWADPKRVADLTLGDFWGIERYAQNLNSKTGTSMVLANTREGKHLLETLLNKGLIHAEAFPVEIAIRHNGCLCAPTELKLERACFFEALSKEPFDAVVNRFLVPRRKWIFDLYYGLPGFLRKFVRRVMDKRMKYE